MHIRHSKQQVSTTHAYKTLKTAGVQTSMVKYPTKQLKRIKTKQNKKT